MLRVAQGHEVVLIDSKVLLRPRFGCSRLMVLPPRLIGQDSSSIAVMVLTRNLSLMSAAASLAKIDWKIGDLSLPIGRVLFADTLQVMDKDLQVL
jgi:hypothetical protein